jgi:predicted O-methyltransferase YrrM
MRHRWEILADLINKNGYTRIVEIGVSRGINAANVLKLCPDIQTMYLVDINDNVFDLGLFYDARVLHKIHFISTGSIAAAKTMPNELDMVFIDAEHSYEACKADIIAWWPKVRTGGILCGHDYVTNQPGYGVIQAVDEIFPQVNLESDVLEDGALKVWWVKK